MRVPGVIIAVAAIGCSYAPTRSGETEDGRNDGSVAGDTNTDSTPANCVVFTGWPFEPSNVCLVPTPVGPFTVPTGVHIYDTGTGLLDGLPGPKSVVDTSQDPDLRVISVTGLSIPQTATLIVTGPHPLAIVVDGGAMIEGTLDVSARDLGAAVWVAGPGGEIACTTGRGVTAANDAAGAPGGGGGAFGGDGATGGGGDGNPLTLGGTIEGNSMLVPLRGGCDAGVGGTGDGAGGFAGRAGGAIQLAVRTDLAISGAIRANGGPGGGGIANDGGGGGGGSGGGILLEANTLAISGFICANGGGGGGGASDNGVSGGLAAIGTCSATTPAGNGTGGSGGGGAGGTGGYAGGGASTGLTGASEGAGGGGGGVGRVHLFGVAALGISGIVTPTAQ